MRDIPPTRVNMHASHTGYCARACECVDSCVFADTYYKAIYMELVSMWVTAYVGYPDIIRVNRSGSMVEQGRES